MKKSIFLVVAILMLSSSTGAVQAQIAAPKMESDSSKCRLERFEARKMGLIEKELKLSPEANKDFKAIYAKYRKELMGSIEKIQPKTVEMTDKELLKRITIRFENLAIVSKIKAKYVDAFAEVLTPKQIMKLYILEGDMGRRIKGAADKCVKKRGECKRGGEGTGRKGDDRPGVGTSK